MEMLTRLIILFTLISTSVYSQDSIFVDCNGTPSPIDWMGDGFCDDGGFTWNDNPINFNCEEFGYDNGDCPLPIDTIPGCTDMLALNFVPEANFNDGSCEYPVFGCTDPEAPNFNPWAQVDNNSCVGVSCSDGEAKMIFKITLDQYPGETGWILTDLSNGQAVESVMAGEYSYEQANQTIVYDLCVPETGVELILSDIYGDGLEGSIFGGSDGDFIILGDAEPCGSLDTLWALEDAGFGGAAYSGPIWLQQCDLPAVEGCTNNSYIEFSPQANLDDGSCETLHTLGCINPNAFNYDSNATLNKIIPTCSYTLIIEDDGGDGWGDCYIGVAQEDSILGIYTMGPGSYSQEFNIILETDKAVKVYYFEIANPQTPSAEVAFQTMHNSFRLINSFGDVTLQGGVYPFSNNGQGALKAYKPPFWNVYDAIPFCGDYCIPRVYGCLDEQALNYNSEANTDDGSCIAVISGCTSPFAFNYDSIANVDDESCVAVVVGCMDNAAWNYNPAANTADESCLYFGCTDNLALNYDSTANVNNDNCIYPIPGCTDPLAFNFDLESNVDDGSCIPVLIGCMDPTMYNYNNEANTESDNCIPFIFGCTDTVAFNYGPVANTDNGSCVSVVHGCINSQSLNYNEGANTDDGSCINIIYGCTDSTMYNYNPLANTDNQSCILFVYGCDDPNALNYNVDANTDDNSCILPIYGCMDSTAFNYNPLANSDNETCESIVYGCTNPIALNYTSQANVDDGSCITPIYGCTDNTMYNYNPLANTDNESCISFVYGCDDPAALNYDAEANTDDNSCILPIYGCMDSTSFNYDVLANTDNESCIEVVYGCTDPAAFNYNVQANTENFSCVNVVYGCTDENAFNYDSLANTNNEGCIDVLEGCMDPFAYNYDVLYNTDDGSCLYDAGCIDGPGIPYWLNDTCYAWVIMVDPYCCNNNWDDKCQQLYWSCFGDSDLDTRDLLRGHNVVMYPNPMGDVLNILTNGPVSIEVHDITGRLVIKIKKNQTHKGLNQLNVSLLPAGVYNFSVTYEGRTTTAKVLKR